jgi:hypothetical protein
VLDLECLPFEEERRRRMEIIRTGTGSEMDCNVMYCNDYNVHFSTSFNYMWAI